MAPGKAVSPIVRAISRSEAGTTGEIRVHISRHWFEKDVLGSAMRVFLEHGMHRTAQRNAVLIYVNTRTRRFAVIGDEGINQAVGRGFWKGLAENLREDLLSTHRENAIAIAVLMVGAALRKHFPADREKA